MTGPNYMQRVFDALKAGGDPMTIAELAARTRLDERQVKDALERMNSDRLLTAICSERIWRYTVKPSAARPGDRRGLRSKRA